MKKTVKLIVALTLVLALAIPAVVPVTSLAADPVYAFYVAPDGSDTNDGTIDAPFATAEKARDAIRELKANGACPDSGVTVYFRGGDYSIDKTFELGEEDSGTQRGPIVYKAYPGEKVSFVGGTVVDTSKFAPVSDAAIKARLPKDVQSKVVQVDLKAQGVTHFEEEKPHGFTQNTLPAPSELFIDDEPMTLSRYPNKGEYIQNSDCELVTQVVWSGSDTEEGDVPAQYKIPYEGVSNWSDVQNIWASGIFGWGYTDDTIQLESIDEDGLITWKTANMSGFLSDSWDKHWYENIVEELDTEGEYYIDKTTGMLFFYPTSNYKTGRMIVSTLADPFVAMEGCSYVSISGITFEGSCGMGIYMENGKENKVLDCTFKNMGTAAVSIGKGYVSEKNVAHNVALKQPLQSRVIGNIKGLLYENSHINREGGEGHVISGCTIYNMGAGGIWCGAGDRATLTPSNIQIVNNEIYDVNRREKTYKPSIWLDGVGIKVAHNELYNAPHVLIHLMGNDHKIEYNNIYNCVLETDDSAAIYAGRNASELGNEINFNYIHENGPEEVHGAGTQGIFWDDGEINCTVYGNVFYRPGTTGAFKTNGPSLFNNVSNNIFIETGRVINISNPGLHRLQNPDFDYNADNDDARMFKNRELGDVINVTNELFTTRYPFMKDVVEADISSNVAKNNVLVDSNIDEGVISSWTVEGIFEGDPKFVDRKNNNFALKDDSPVYTDKNMKGFEKVPFNLMGRINTIADSRAQELVSLFVGNPNAMVKGERTYVDPENLAVKPLIIDDRTLVPVRFISESFGGEVGWDGDTGTITITSGGKEIKLQLNSDVMTVDGVETKLEVPAQSIEGRTLIPLRALCEQALGKNVFWDARGLIVISDNENIFDETHEGYLVDEIINRTIAK